MLCPLLPLVYSLLFVSCRAARVEGDCIRDDEALNILAKQLSPNSIISCKGQPLSIFSANRYWGKQYGKNASVVVFPTTTEDVSKAMKASKKSKCGNGLSFVSGAHAQTFASSTKGFQIDLSWMNQTKILHNVKVDDASIDTAIQYQSGATWEGVAKVTNNSGYTAIGARVGNVGVGGFSTGGGVGFLGGSYGFAVDRVRAFEVVLPDGRMVNATKTNKYSDLFWALQGGNGQFGAVTTFYQEAAAEPTQSQLGFFFIAPGKANKRKAYENIADFFTNHGKSGGDPFSLMYYDTGLFPPALQGNSTEPTDLIVALRFSNPNDPKQKSFNETFRGLLSGIDFTAQQISEVPFASATTYLLEPFFPYGSRRGFWGSRVTEVDADFIAKVTDVVAKSVSDLQATGESPVSHIYALQYQFPGLNGHQPKNDDDTAWPHAVTAHQTLFSPAWNRSSNDALVYHVNDMLNKITWDRQAQLDPPFVADYPNYMSPNVTARRLFGDNVDRLIQVKEKYDPDCRLHQGRTWATNACKKLGVASFFP
ncbi:FAD-binding domain-containing protein [Acaromyces ingoldii]|uniref:FAD-binding domain-containing protein n=1 Tax=Acaromyces ingoldii TaxID=215250 RepID=A0A316YG60_9BASI|nr:FAD-binding domain-containing protein [Acaromyces ingoldii]PWN88397.1 FAD-binding domain-containing protein [Acaromyces ingoldii]